MKNNQKGISLLIVVIILLALAVVSILGFFVYKNYFSGAKQTTSDPNAWQVLSSGKVGYSLKIPPKWYSEQNENDTPLSKQDYLFNLKVSPDALVGTNANRLTIFFPISIQGQHFDLGKMFEKGLSGLEVEDTPKESSSFSSREISYTTISGKRTLVVKKKLSTDPPENYKSAWCGECVYKDYYADLGNGKILNISAKWTNDRTDLESVYDQIISSIKLTQ